MHQMLTGTTERSVDGIERQCRGSSSSAPGNTKIWVDLFIVDLDAPDAIDDQPFFMRGGMDLTDWRKSGAQ